MTEYKIPPSVMPYVNPDSYRDWMEGVERAKANPPGAVDEFAASYETMAVAVEQAIAEGLRRQTADELDEAARKNLESWQTHTLPLLKAHLAAIQAAAEEFRASDPSAILKCAEDEAHLAKNLDGYWMPFAPAAWEQILEVHVGRVVRIASLVCEALRFAF